MVGDKSSDILFGLALGAVPVLVLTGYGREAELELAAGPVRPAHVAADLAAAADWIVARERAAGRPPRAAPARRRARS